MKWWRARSQRTQGVIAILALLAIYGLSQSGSAQQGARDGSSAARASSGPTDRTGAVAAATTRPTPTATPTTRPATPSPTPRPTATPSPTPTPVPSPIVLRGTGQTATSTVTLPSSTSVGTFTHQGGANFIVYVFRGDRKDLLINVIGPYGGSRPLFYAEPIQFSIQADGAWTVTIEAAQGGGTVAASGKGDAVTKGFAPPGTGAYRFTHDGGSNFVVYLHCAGARQLIQNEIGAFTGSKIVQFGRAPCMWEVVADGNWSIAAQ